MTTPRSGLLADAPLEQLFPEAGPQDLEVIRREAARLDAALGPLGPARWEWEPGVLVTDLTVGEDDPVEYTLQVDCSEGAGPCVFAGVSVACGCAEDHRTHLVDQAPVYLTEMTSLHEGTELGTAFSFAAWELAGWLARPRDAARWRALNGLPAPPTAAHGD
ncbi:hypothetical protein [Streptomyces sp. NPDC058773]|uniref:hypothetical protein n=1 Tax=Streptomyces sp. NPDC058773 TaxID=3346632 RepID=UPI00367CEC2F